MKKNLAIAMLLTFSGGWAPVDILASEESETTMSIATVTFEKKDFTDLETIHAVVTGSFATDCLKLEAPFIAVAAERIDIQPRASRDESIRICRDAFVPWSRAIEIQTLPLGDYLVSFGLVGQRQVITVRARGANP